MAFNTERVLERKKLPVFEEVLLEDQVRRAAELIGGGRLCDLTEVEKWLCGAAGCRDIGLEGRIARCPFFK